MNAISQTIKYFGSFGVIFGSFLGHFGSFLAIFGPFRGIFGQICGKFKFFCGSIGVAELAFRMYGTFMIQFNMAWP